MTELQTSGGGPITARFEFDEAEHRLALRESSPAWTRWVAPVAGIAIPALMLWIGVGRSWRELTPVDALLNGLPWVLLGAFFLSLGPMLRRAAAKRALEYDPSLNGTQLRTVDERGLHVQGAGYAPSLPWQGFQRITESHSFFLFYEDRHVMHYIPKRVLSDVERDSLRNLIQARSRP